MNVSARPRQRVHSYTLGEGQLDEQRVLQVLRDGVSKSDWREKESKSRKASKRTHILLGIYILHARHIHTEQLTQK